MGVGPISVLSVLEYARAHEFDADQTEDLVWFVPRLDAKYLKWVGRGKEPERPQP